MRAFLAYIALWILCPKWKMGSGSEKFRDFIKDEIGFCLMAVFGNTLYYLCENSALLYTYSSNVSILVSAAPLATAILLLLFDRKNAGQLTGKVMAGMFAAFAGMCLVVLNGSLILHLSWKGDILSICGAFSWGVYSIILIRYTSRFSGFFISRKLMFYTMLTAIPVLLHENQSFPIGQIIKPQYLCGILFLGLIGSAFCYAAWNMACAGLGIVKANMYIYTIPFVTLAAGAVFLHERITVMAVAGALLIAAGMKISSV